ncbi:retinoic acid receptor responder protein 2 [Engystomops pustulosus]|uniref:retinoic acid receptor responder protein 2 n=1 Tax=Engystomops pustulosus TaxID=76066 RepID=UPI003AFA14DB
MKTTAITWCIISALLVVTSQSEIKEKDFTDIQRKAFRLVMESLHNKEHVRNSFRVSDILTATDIDYSAGIFVNLEFALKQTSCHKSHWTKTDCEILKNGRTFNCFACFKFTYGSHDIMSQLIDCVTAHQVDAKRSSSRSQSCKKVELKGGPGKPGSYAFVTSQ